MRRVIRAIVLAAIVFIINLSLQFYVFAADTGIEPVKIRCTCYCYNSGVTAAGTKPKQGLTVAGRKEWMGKACVLYRINEEGEIGDLIGMYQFLDTGGELISQGKRIDVYRNTLDECHDWVNEYGDYVYMQVIDVEG